MPFLKSVILSIVITLFVPGCSRNNEQPAFEFTAHRIKLKYDEREHIFSVQDTISLTFNSNIDYIYFFLHDSLKLTHVSIGNQELTPVPADPRLLEHLPPITKEIAGLIDKSQIIQLPVPKSLYPKTIQLWYQGILDARELDIVAWHPFIPGDLSDFHITALLPAEIKPAQGSFLLRLDCDGEWCLWQGDSQEGKQFCSIQFNDGSF